MSTNSHTIGTEPFALSYGALEAVLKNLLGAQGDAIVTRFRKLRPKFSADGLLTETGNRVRYDLTRALAICAIFEINALSIPQGHAVDIVVANWPEIAAASLAAWRDATGTAHPKEGPNSSVVRIFVDALNSSPKDGSWAALGAVATDGVPQFVLTCRPAVDAIVEIAQRDGRADQLALAFDELDSTFGCHVVAPDDPIRLPRRRESDFFGTGPYFDRARALLTVEPSNTLNRRRKARLQALLTYLEMPAPIDGWKRYIGTADRKPRLVHLLAGWGVGLGLRSTVAGQSGVLESAWTDRAEAMRLIGRGEARVAELIAEGAD